jgi:hypothetical protein
MLCTSWFPFPSCHINPRSSLLFCQGPRDDHDVHVPVYSFMVVPLWCISCLTSVPLYCDNPFGSYTQHRHNPSTKQVPELPMTPYNLKQQLLQCTHKATAPRRAWQSILEALTTSFHPYFNNAQLLCPTSYKRWSTRWLMRHNRRHHRGYHLYILPILTMSVFSSTSSIQSITTTNQTTNNNVQLQQQQQQQPRRGQLCPTRYRREVYVSPPSSQDQYWRVVARKLQPDSTKSDGQIAKEQMQGKADE